MQDNDLANRLKKLVDADPRSPKQISLDAGLGETAVHDILRGKSRKPQATTLHRIAQSLRVDLQLLLDEDEALPDHAAVPPNSGPHIRPAPVSQQRDLPVLGEARGGDDGFFLHNGDVLAYAERPPELMQVRGAYALVMRGTSMEPRYFDGELLRVHPFRRVHAGSFVHIETHDGRSYVKQYLRRDDKWTWFRQLNPEATLQLRTDDIKSIRRIVSSTEDW